MPEWLSLILLRMGEGRDDNGQQAAGPLLKDNVATANESGVPKAELNISNEDLSFGGSKDITSLVEQRNNIEKEIRA